MLYPIAIETGNSEQAFGVAVPDIQGCFSAGDSLDDAMANVKEAIEGHLELLAEMKQLPPQATSLSKWVNDDEFKGWAWAIIDIDIDPYMGKASKINVTLPNLLSKKIDSQVKMHPNLYKSRSHFLQVAAAHELSHINSSVSC
ncbi:type II toxin-antitoxin system HicB family antitoxin [Moritella sp.]|uniref:type II toxin-antitoxin system HicB family antitoxin n=1 Tax=Moritella sp. TaxID=78556 RepID=UPI0025EEE32C|nr:type II toxin-antitoxin system HicB family antitoxin [Moritella sp.]MCJ8352304.1 type II toxin-antitoxin system HicB family antitoxin [Moritella sp.]